MRTTIHTELVRSEAETPTVRTFHFERPRGDRGDGFEYVAGQFVNLILPGSGSNSSLRHSFTLSSSPTEPETLAITTRMSGSDYKSHLWDLDEGDEVEMAGPAGRFTLDSSRPAVMMAGGIGITPFRSILRYVTDSAMSLPIRLLYSSRRPSEIVFYDELSELDSRHSWFELCCTVTRPDTDQQSWAGRTGRIDAELIRRTSRSLDNPLYYLCGPPGMVDGMSEVLHEQLGLADDDVATERFVGY